MIRIAALTDHAYTPSSRFRVRQHIPALAAQGIAVTDFPRRWSTQSAGKLFPNQSIRSSVRKAAVAGGFEALNVAHTLKRVLASRHFDGTWASRELVIGYPTFESLVRSPLFYDIDDAVFLNPRTAIAVQRLLPAATAVLAGNEYLASYCRQYSQSVHVIPTAIDVHRYFPAPPPGDEEFVVGWSGTSSSFRFFLPIQERLGAFFRAHPEAVLKVCADRYPNELTALREHIRFEPWSAAREVEQIQSFHVGLMPLDDTEWTKGKCSYKFLLYASCAVPTICSPYGMNLEVLKLGKVGIPAVSAADWHEALEYCFAERASLRSLFPDCRTISVERFSADSVSRQIAALMLQRRAAP